MEPGPPGSGPKLRRAVIPTCLAFLAVGALFPGAPIQDAATGLPPDETGLTASPAYLIGAPLWRVLDTIALLGLSQHIAVVATALGVFVAWRVVRRRRPRGLVGRAVAETGAAGLFLAGLLAVYGATAFVPHASQQLAMADPEVMRVDFHSHSGHSRDASQRYSVDWNRTWHRRTGFDVAYLTDHSTWAGMQDAGASNPRSAGADVVLLPGIEGWFKGDHAVALGDSARHRITFDSTLWRVEPDSLMRQREERPATLAIVLPLDHPERVLGLGPDAPDGAVALEIVDGSPKGLDQGRNDRTELLELADEHNLALISGSNTHGTGQTAAAWTLMRIPGWREMRPNQLEVRINERLHADRRAATQVVERTMPHGTSPMDLALTVPALAWHAATTMGWPERLVWLLYGVGAMVAGGWFSRRHPAA